jgi:transcriptional regulator NrdR family protein
MKCPACGAWTSVKQTRTRKTDGVVTRRYECGNLHRFSTEERVWIRTETESALLRDVAPDRAALFRHPLSKP